VEIHPHHDIITIIAQVVTVMNATFTTLCFASSAVVLKFKISVVISLMFVVYPHLSLLKNIRYTSVNVDKTGTHARTDILPRTGLDESYFRPYVGVVL